MIERDGCGIPFTITRGHMNPMHLLYELSALMIANFLAPMPTKLPPRRRFGAAARAFVVAL